MLVRPNLWSRSIIMVVVCLGFWCEEDVCLVRAAHKSFLYHACMHAVVVVVVVVVVGRLCWYVPIYGQDL
jgi:hypothetical protein